MEGRIIQALIIAAIVAVVAGSLVAEYWAGPRYRRWRARRRHRHAGELLATYRALRDHLRERRLAQVLAADAPVLVSPTGTIAASAVMPVAWGQDN
jgi:hypothetical protein